MIIIIIKQACLGHVDGRQAAGGEEEEIIIIILLY